MAKRVVGEPRYTKRVRYMTMGNALLSGEAAPVFVMPKQRLKPAPKAGGAVANAGDLFSIGEGAIKLGLSAVFTPRDVYRQAKRGYEKDEEQAQHYLKYESSLSPIYTAYSRKFREEDMAKRERELLAKGEKIELSEYPTRQEEERELRRKMREEQGRLKNGKWIANKDAEELRAFANKQRAYEIKDGQHINAFYKSEYPYLNRLKHADKQQIRFYPDIPINEKLTEEDVIRAREKARRDREQYEKTQSKYGKTIPQNQLKAIKIRFRAKQGKNVHVTEGNYGFTGGKQNIKTFYKPLSQNISTSYKTPEPDLKTPLSPLTNLFPRNKPEYTGKASDQEIQRFFRLGLKGEGKKASQNIKTSYKQTGLKLSDARGKPSKKSFRSTTDTWQGYRYPGEKIDVFKFGGKEFPDIFKKYPEERTKYQTRYDTHLGVRTPTGIKDTRITKDKVIRSKQNIKTNYTTPGFTIEPIKPFDMSIFEKLKPSATAKKSVAKKPAKKSKKGGK